MVLCYPQGVSLPQVIGEGVRVCVLGWKSECLRRGSFPGPATGQVGLPFIEMGHRRTGWSWGGRKSSLSQAEMSLTFGYESVLGWSKTFGNSPVEGLLVLGLLFGGMSLIPGKVQFPSPVPEIPTKHDFLFCRCRVRPLF